MIRILKTGYKTVGTTATKLIDTETPCKFVQLWPSLLAGDNIIYFGDATSQPGWVMHTYDGMSFHFTNAPVTVHTDDASKIYVKSVTSNQNVYYIVYG